MGYKKITARFLGENDSLGYKKGVYYTLLLKPGDMTIVRQDGKGLCSYGSITSFINNWTDIQHIED